MRGESAKTYKGVFLATKGKTGGTLLRPVSLWSVVDSHRGDDCLDVADVGHLEGEAHDYRLSVPELLVDAFLEPGMAFDNRVCVCA